MNNNVNGVSADSSFYICFVDDLEEKEWIYKFIKLYSFYIGRRVLSEIPDTLLNDDDFRNSVTVVDYDYYSLIKPIFGRDPKHLEDGEYEAIGIAHYLDILGELRYLILDDRRAKNFVKNNFEYLADKVVGTIGFIRNSCLEDRKLECEKGVEILNKIKETVKSGKKRPLNLNEKKCKEIIDPIIEELLRGGNNGGK